MCYRGHDARFHWFTHFFVGSSVALTVMAVVAAKKRRPLPLPLPLLWPFVAHVAAMLPDFLFTAGIAHERWMDVFLGHITTHFVPGRTWFVVFLASLAAYLLVVARSAAPRESPTGSSPARRSGRTFAAERGKAAADRISGLAAEVAFYAVLGIFPGLLALAAALGFLESIVGGDVADRAQRVVVDFLDSFLGDRASGTVDAVRSLFDEGDATLLSFATAGAVWSMWRATRAAMRALAVVYDVEEARSPVRAFSSTSRWRAGPTRCSASPVGS